MPQVHSYQEEQTPKMYIIRGKNPSTSKYHGLIMPQIQHLFTKEHMENVLKSVLANQAEMEQDTNMKFDFELQEIGTVDMLDHVAEVIDAILIQHIQRLVGPVEGEEDLGHHPDCPMHPDNISKN